MPSPSATPSPEAIRQRRVNRPWRIAFVLFAAALTIGTHWPRLQFGPEMPASDKTIHLLAFAAATFLLWRTRWISSRWGAASIVLIWSLLDEFSQGIPLLNRTVAWQDVIANVLGVIVAGAMLWALRPVGAVGGPNRMRLALGQYVMDEMFARRRSWIAAGIGALAGGLPLAALWPWLSVEAARIAIVCAILVSGVVSYLLWNRIWWAEYRRIAEARPCLRCGAPAEAAKRDAASGAHMCTDCGAERSAAQWAELVAPAMQTRLLAVRPAAMLGAAIIAGVFVTVLLLPTLYAWLLGASRGEIVRFAHLIASLPAELANVIDLSVLLIGVAIVVRVHRIALARHLDQYVLCRACGHDLRGTPTVNGIGRCGECGAEFSRPTASIKSKARR